MFCCLGHGQDPGRGDDRERKERGAGLETERDEGVDHVREEGGGVDPEREVGGAAREREEVTEVDRERGRDLVQGKDGDRVLETPGDVPVQERERGAVRENVVDPDREIEKGAGDRHPRTGNTGEGAILKIEIKTFEQK